jgi:hypothetical protein
MGIIATRHGDVKQSLFRWMKIRFKLDPVTVPA